MLLLDDERNAKLAEDQFELPGKSGESGGHQFGCAVSDQCYFERDFRRREDGHHKCLIQNK